MSLSAPETASILRFEEMVGSHFFYPTEKCNGKGEFIESATFNVAGYDWTIQFYPNGDTRAEEGHTSIYLHLKSEAAQNVLAQPTFVILNQNEQLLSVYRAAEVYTFMGKTDSNGFINFVKRSAIESGLMDDCILIRCIVTVFKPRLVKADLGYHIPVPPSEFKQQIISLLENGNGADVTFKVNGQTFNAHKFILAARSQVFESLFFGPCKEESDTVIEIEDIEAPVFKSLLHFIYSDTVPEFEERDDNKNNHSSKLMAQRLLVAADRYGLEGLKMTCEMILYGRMDSSNVVEQRVNLSIQKQLIQLIFDLKKIVSSI
ncbi:BTB/POZ and MATH domain-containing protein 2 [Rhynchospora pubera]|uniref:BTB/POZ and MATH domain-containing protein 2 n=1 Tax=Rhynchospora pubera TaxID=906938 RepID=A0AAV8DK11_9POAL|nr:BTB/POZ and MATH domain-containing protein 2 [Rhynchospora pubera]